MPFSGSLSGSVVCAKGLGKYGREVGEGGEKEKVRWRRNRALRTRVVEKFAFSSLSRDLDELSFVSLRINCASPSTSVRSIVIAAVIPRSRPFCDSANCRAGNSRQAACRKVAYVHSRVFDTTPLTPFTIRLLNATALLRHIVSYTLPIPKQSLASQASLRCDVYVKKTLQICSRYRVNFARRIFFSPSPPENVFFFLPRISRKIIFALRPQNNTDRLVLPSRYGRSIRNSLTISTDEFCVPRSTGEGRGRSRINIDARI